MKEIKAYIRSDAIDPVVRDLERVSARDLAIIRVDAPALRVVGRRHSMSAPVSPG